jgi:hypothetical protein
MVLIPSTGARLLRTGYKNVSFWFGPSYYFCWTVMELRKPFVLSLVMEEGEEKREWPIKIDWEGGKKEAMCSGEADWRDSTDRRTDTPQLGEDSS